MNIYSSNFTLPPPAIPLSPANKEFLPIPDPISTCSLFSKRSPPFKSEKVSPIAFGALAQNSLHDPKNTPVKLFVIRGTAPDSDIVPLEKTKKTPFYLSSHSIKESKVEKPPVEPCKQTVVIDKSGSSEKNIPLMGADQIQNYRFASKSKEASDFSESKGISRFFKKKKS